MSGRVVSDMYQTRAEGKLESREVVSPIQHVRTRILQSTCDSDTNGCKRWYSSRILEIGMILGVKIEQKVYKYDELVFNSSITFI